MTASTPISSTTDRLGDDPRGLYLLVVLPALNEEKTVAQVVSRIPAADEIEGVGRVDVLVIDDGSHDSTSQLAQSAGATVMRNSKTKGLGTVFQSALAQGIDRRADLVVTIDSDGQFDPATIPALIAPVVAGKADFTTASRFIDPELVPNMPWIKKWGNRMMSRLVSSLAGQELFDVSCGMRCYSRSAALHLYPQARFTYTQEAILNLAYKGLRIVEVPIRVAGQRAHGRSRVANNLLHYALRTSRIIFSCYRDFYPLRFFGALAAVCGIGSLLLSVFFLHHYASTGAFRPHTWAGMSAGALFGLGVLMLHMGVIGDMLNRHRIYLEELLYRQRAMASREDGSSIADGR